MINVTTADFLQAIDSLEIILSDLQFKRISTLKKGYACYTQFKNNINGNIIEFIFGPPDFQIEILIYNNNIKYSFKDLLQNISINKWVKDNAYIQDGDRCLKNEIMWYSKLIEYSLPILK